MDEFTGVGTHVPAKEMPSAADASDSIGRTCRTDQNSRLGSFFINESMITQ